MERPPPHQFAQSPSLCYPSPMKQMSWTLVFILSLFALPKIAMAQQLTQNAAKTKWPECFCTDRYGKRRELGEIICISVGSRSYMAKCVMAQNVPFWRDQERGCLSSSLPPAQSPVQTSVVALYQ